MNLTAILAHPCDFTLTYSILGWTATPVGGNIEFALTDADAALALAAMKAAFTFSH